MNRLPLRVALAACALAVAPLPAAQGPQPPLVTVNVAVERPGVSITEKPATGAQPETTSLAFAPWRLETGLQPEDFDLVANGIAAPVVACTPHTGPVSIVFVIDATPSTDADLPVTWLPDIMRDTLARVVHAGDRVAVGRVGGAELRFSPGFDTDARTLVATARDLLKPTDKDKASLLFELEPSPIWDAVDRAVGMLESQAGRRAIILFTDGRSSGNRHSAADVTQHALAAGTSLNVVSMARDELIRQAGTMSARVRPGLMLEGMASVTGGAFMQVWQVARFFRAPEDKSIKATMASALVRMFEEVHGGYALTFASPLADGQLHPLKVRVTKPGLRVRAPSSYRAQATARLP